MPPPRAQRFDRAYYDRFYRDRKTRVGDGAADPVGVADRVEVKDVLDVYTA